MLQFETLLLRQLQKQQNRDEFCDTVLHTQGVSVPVHSCVLSAFSPRLYGTLSSMPAPISGQRRLIELQAVDACTLLSLVSLLYSGQLHENREQVFSAAQTLGIELPQWQEEERHGGKVGRRKDSEDVEQDMEEEVYTRKWDDKMARRMGADSRGENEKKKESGTQTECESEEDGRDAETELACTEPQNLQTVYLIDQVTCSTNQELGICMDLHDSSLAMQGTYPERKSTTCDVITVTPETINCHKVSEIVTLHPHNSFLDQSVVVPVGVDAINDLRQYEGNIPGFINHFLNSSDFSITGRRGQGHSGGGAKEDQLVKRASAASRQSLKEWVSWLDGGRGGRRSQMKRWGLVAGLAWRGQGGGRVGRLLETRTTGKNPKKEFWRQRGKKVFAEAKEARGRDRRRKRGTNAGSQRQQFAPDEEDDVDVLEVSSGASELLAVSPVILEVDLSTEEEDVEDVEIDVLGLEQD
ncbi:BTB/POZ domain-containing protein 18 [Silurus asotus]|uniref:BTB/POZ domain-containing protein 18 n=1 Tax=Silurus asotus TaxID=30991 RepID=A0AAD5AZ89_SILAS|nr:BTB/POZ domain-containing protein 18 [Silurus asotus]